MEQMIGQAKEVGCKVYNEYITEVDLTKRPFKFFHPLNQFT